MSAMASKKVFFFFTSCSPAQDPGCLGLFRRLKAGREELIKFLGLVV